MSKAPFLVVLYLALTISLSQGIARRGEAQEAEADLQQQLWGETRALLKRREYGLAVNLLETSLEDPDLFDYTSRIQKDLDAIKRLEKLSETVEYASKNLAPSTPVTVLSNKLSFVRQTTGKSGISLVFRNSSGAEVTYPLNRIDSEAWLQLGKRETQAWPDEEMVTGIFLAFDRYPQTAAARAKLNAAAKKGQEVAVWIKRLDASKRDRNRKTPSGSPEKSAEDLLFGKWRVAAKGGLRLIWEIRRDGKAFVTHKGTRRPATWEKESEGVFRISMANGSTAKINVATNRIFGRFANGNPYQGLRMAE